MPAYMIFLKTGDAEAGQVGPYKTRRAASADAKTLVRLHVGKGPRISETGNCGKSTDNKQRFLSVSYSAQAQDKPVFTAEIHALTGKKATAANAKFQVQYNPKKKAPRKLSCGKVAKGPKRKSPCSKAKKAPKQNPLISFTTRGGKTISFDAKRR